MKPEDICWMIASSFDNVTHTVVFEDRELRWWEQILVRLGWKDKRLRYVYTWSNDEPQSQDD